MFRHIHILLIQGKQNIQKGFRKEKKEKGNTLDLGDLITGMIKVGINKNKEKAGHGQGWSPHGLAMGVTKGNDKR